jgi:hypothetical protein
MEEERWEERWRSGRDGGAGEMEELERWRSGRDGEEEDGEGGRGKMESESERVRDDKAR